MRRREFIAGLGAAAWPLAVRAQQGDRVRRIGVLMSGNENDPAAKASVSAFAQALAELGWTDGRNMRIELRWGGGDIDRIRALAQELVGLQPDIIAANGTAATAVLQRETRTIPIILVIAGDPVASGIVERIDRPCGNVTRLRQLGTRVGRQVASFDRSPIAKHALTGQPRWVDCDQYLQHQALHAQSEAVSRQPARADGR